MINWWKRFKQDAGITCPMDTVIGVLGAAMAAGVVWAVVWSLSMVGGAVR